MALRVTRLRGEARQRRRALTSVDVPMPPEDLRALTGRSNVEDYENPNGDPVYPYLPAQAYTSVLDFGCGCGRTARQLLLQRTPPLRYLGIDLDPRGVSWCQGALEPIAPGFRFLHHDVYNPVLNAHPDLPRELPLPAEDEAFSLVHGWSVWTHLPQPQAEHYLHEAARVLRPGGLLHATWLLFEKHNFPCLYRNQHALYVNHEDPTQAVYFDRSWVLEQTAALDLWVVHVEPPSYRGFSWTLVMRKGAPREHLEVPMDTQPVPDFRLW